MAAPTPQRSVEQVLTDGRVDPHLWDRLEAQAHQVVVQDAVQRMLAAEARVAQLEQHLAAAHRAARDLLALVGGPDGT